VFVVVEPAKQRAERGEHPASSRRRCCGHAPVRCRSGRPRWPHKTTLSFLTFQT
jgi:hypothetical protein